MRIVYITPEELKPWMRTWCEGDIIRAQCESCGAWNLCSIPSAICWRCGNIVPIGDLFAPDPAQSVLAGSLRWAMHFFCN